MTYSQGPRCAACQRTEADCAYQGGCCQPCSHFAHLDGRGNDRVTVPTIHGTESAYQRHRYRREAACEPCKAAHSRHVITRRAAS